MSLQGKTSGGKFKNVFLSIIQTPFCMTQQISSFLILPLRGMPLFLWPRSAFATPSASPKPRDSSDKTVILSEQCQVCPGVFWASRCSLGHRRRNFPLRAFPGESSFPLVLFYRHRWKWVAAVRVTVFLSRKY